MTALDWIVVVAYMLAMLGVGEYYSRRNKSTEDYLLGGRNLGTTSVGLSLFASLLSTISYLAIPGEMIKHGPMIFADILTYPLVYFIVGWLLIPRFMALNVATAYQPIEARLGLGMRLLGSVLFLAIRLLWMGVIVYVTAKQILVPLMGLPEYATPLVCIAMGVVTVIYTSVGGLQAVVITDAVQSLILLAGAVLTLVCVSISIGGPNQWLPTEWPEHWDHFELGFQANARVTVLATCISGLLWWLCTAGSDQMAIQRYLSTRDAQAARRALAVSLLATALSTVLLAAVGLAVLAYFKVHSSALPAGADIVQNADALFPRYIVVGFVPGVTGTVIAGLIAAAMSSLSSGINSSCSVIAVDFLDRLGRGTRSEAGHLRHTKAISWAVGSFAVIASTFVGFIEGSLLELCYKAVNLLVAPLFLIVFMTMCVPWATARGTLAGVVVSTIVAAGIAYGDWFGLSFLWILPASFAAGALVAVALDLALPGRRRT